jgi:hypothetical protein
LDLAWSLCKPRHQFDVASNKLHGLFVRRLSLDIQIDTCEKKSVLFIMTSTAMTYCVRCYPMGNVKLSFAQTTRCEDFRLRDPIQRVPLLKAHSEDFADEKQRVILFVFCLLWSRKNQRWKRGR